MATIDEDFGMQEPGDKSWGAFMPGLIQQEGWPGKDAPPAPAAPEAPAPIMPTAAAPKSALTGAPAGFPKLPDPALAQLQARHDRREKDADALLPIIQQRYEGIGQGYKEMQEGQSALKTLLQNTQQRLSGAFAPASKAERLSGVLGAVASAKPGSGFGGAAGAGALVGSQQMKEGRELNIAKEQLMAKYGIDAVQADQMARQYGIAGQTAGLQGLQARFNADESAADRTSAQIAAQSTKNMNQPVVNINGVPAVNNTLLDAKAKLAEMQQRGRNTANNAALTPEVIDLEATIARANGGKLDYAFTRSNPLAGPAIMARAAEMERQEGNEPQAIVYEGQATKARQAAANSWNSSSPTSGGTMIRRLGVTINHMQVLRQYLQALQNGDVSTINRAKMAVQKELNLSSVPATVDALTPILSNEMTAAINSRGGTGHERDAATDALGKSRDYGVQADILGGETKLLAGQLGGLKTQYEASNMSQVLGPFRGRVDSKILRDATLAAAIGEAPDTSPVHVHTPEEAAMYSPGTPLILPDGTTRYAK